MVYLLHRPHVRKICRVVVESGSRLQPFYPPDPWPPVIDEVRLFPALTPMMDSRLGALLESSSHLLESKKEEYANAGGNLQTLLQERLHNYYSSQGIESRTRFETLEDAQMATYPVEGSPWSRRSGRAGERDSDDVGPDIGRCRAPGRHLFRLGKPCRNQGRSSH